jgi:hypothetical protein
MAARIQRSFRATSSKKLPVANHNRNTTWPYLGIGFRQRICICYLTEQDHKSTRMLS